MAGQHARGGRAQPYMDDSPLPIAYNLYSPFLLQSPKYYTQLSTTASQCKPVETISAPGIYAQYQINRNGYFPFFLEPPGLKNLESKVASQKVPARKAPSSGKPATEESWPRASHEQSATQKDAAVGEVGSSQESATKKDSRGVRHFFDFPPLLLFTPSHELLHMVMLTRKCTSGKTTKKRL